MKNGIGMTRQEASYLEHNICLIARCDSFVAVRNPHNSPVLVLFCIFELRNPCHAPDAKHTMWITEARDLILYVPLAA